MRRYCLYCFASLLLLACGRETSLAGAPVERGPFLVESVVQGLEHPWSLAFIDANHWLVTERPGRLRQVVDGELLEEPVAGVPRATPGGQGGLMDVVLHPQFADNRWVYLSYSKAREDGQRTTALGRGQWRDGRLEDFRDLFVSNAWSDKGQHFGGRIALDGEYVFLTIGDRGDRDRAQDRLDHAGTVIRLHDDGRVPEDNPWVGDDSGRNEIWSWGHRNPQGLAFHPQTGALWSHEHGPRGGDEINVIEREVNYGWPIITYGREYYGPEIGEERREGLAQPLKHWTPSIAPSGMAHYRGEPFAEWQGDWLVGALAEQLLSRNRFDDREPVQEWQYLEGEWRIRDVRTGPDGFIYLLTDSDNGRVVRLRPAADQD